METQPIELATAIIIIAAGTAVLISSVVSTILSVIAVKRANEVLTLQKQFVANMSHELRTPLASIMGYAELAVSGDLPPSMIDSVFDKMHRAARRMRWLIDNALYTLMLSNGEIELMPVNLADVVAQAVQETAVMYPNVTVQCDEVVDVLVVGDARLLFSAVTNLLDNAIKFSPGQTAVCLTLAKVGKTAVLTVTDSGIGISPEMQEIMFDYHRQGDGSDTRRFGGVGIGLWIVEKAMTRHSGRVEVESELGQGSTFRLILPVYEHE